MNIDQINRKLTRIFKEEKKRIVFWYDGEKEFEESLPAVHVEDVTLLRLDEIGALDLKIRIETQDNKGKYLLYAPYYEPEPEKDWLLDKIKSADTTIIKTDAYKRIDEILRKKGK